MGQKIMIPSDDYQELDAWLLSNDLQRVLLVCGKSIRFLRINEYLDSAEQRLGTQIIRFSGFSPNPSYESVVRGVDLFLRKHCQAIIAVGGGSAMDVAKCIKLFSNMNPDDGTAEKNYLGQKIRPNEIPFLAMPTTAGTGSESTRYAVIYFNGEKQSITDNSIIPTTVLMDSGVLHTLPLYTKKAAALDALCHAIESFWSVNSTEKSRDYSQCAIKSILSNLDRYLAGDETASTAMLYAANTAGKAINITQTTAGHAMCYKLTSLYGIAHGHAAALVNIKLFPWMIENTDKCTDPRGKAYLEETFAQIAHAMDCWSAGEAAHKLQSLVAALDMERPVPKDNQYEILKKSVNPVRLKNNPIKLDEDTIDILYHKILSE